MEYVIPTAEVKHLFPSLPNHYKVDLADPERKLAIEVDGNSHKTKKWKFLDRRKESVLAALGWSVLRFWNQEILEDIDRVVGIIQSFTISKSLITTTSLQKES
jgi:very-short-patch-repair endonuclease